MSQLTLGVRELQANLGTALRAVQADQRVVVTSRGKPVALLVGAKGVVRGEPAVDRKLRRLAAAGKAKLGASKPIRAFRAPRIGGLSAQVLADRR